MTADFQLAVQWILTQPWRLFTGFHIPGTNITPAMVLMFGLFTRLVLKMVPAIFNISPLVFGNRFDSNGDTIKRHGK